MIWSTFSPTCAAVTFLRESSGPGTLHATFLPKKNNGGTRAQNAFYRLNFCGHCIFSLINLTETQVGQNCVAPPPVRRRHPCGAATLCVNSAFRPCTTGSDPGGPPRWGLGGNHCHQPKSRVFGPLWEPVLDQPYTGIRPKGGAKRDTYPSWVGVILDMVFGGLAYTDGSKPVPKMGCRGTPGSRGTRTT